MMIKSFYKSDNRDFTIVHGDCFDVLPKFDFKFDMIFADPQCNNMGKNQSTSKHFMPFLYILNRVHYLGAQVPEGAS